MEKLKEYLPLNFGLMANPVNWVIIVLMIAIAALAVYHIFPNNTVEEN